MYRLYSGMGCFHKAHENISLLRLLTVGQIGRWFILNEAGYIVGQRDSAGTWDMTITNRKFHN